MIVPRFDLTYLSIDSIQEGVGSSQITPLILGLARDYRKVCLISFEKNKPGIDLINKFKIAGVEWKPREFGNVGALAGALRLNELRKSLPLSDVLHGRSDIPTVAAIWSKVEAPVLWDVRSLWSDQRKLIGTPGWNRFTAGGARILENFSANNSAAMTTLTAAVIPILEKRHSSLPLIREVIPTCVQTLKFTPTPMPKGPLVCLLSGTFNNYYDIDRTRQIIAAIRESVDLKVIWARAGESPATRLGVGEDSVVSASHSQMPNLVANSHFGMAICKEDDIESLAAAVPTKIGEFLASGRPVIVSRGIGDMEDILRGSNAGIIISRDESLSQIGEQISSLVGAPGIEEQCRALALEHFDMGKAVTSYSKIYSKMIGGSE
jgi:glycosyltransferase involved in cell wall biosynthesis